MVSEELLTTPKASPTVARTVTTQTHFHKMGLRVAGVLSLGGDWLTGSLEKESKVKPFEIPAFTVQPELSSGRKEVTES